MNGSDILPVRRHKLRMIRDVLIQCKISKAVHAEPHPRTLLAAIAYLDLVLTSPGLSRRPRTERRTKRFECQHCEKVFWSDRARRRHTINNH